MKSGLLVIIFLLVLMFVYREAQALSQSTGLIQCSEDGIVSNRDCLKDSDQDELTKITGTIDSVKCVEETKDFQRFQIHFNAKAKPQTDVQTPENISFTVFKSDSKDKYKKSVYFIKGETPTLWLRRRESTWRIAQVKWFGKDLSLHQQGPPVCKL